MIKQFHFNVKSIVIALLVAVFAGSTLLAVVDTTAVKVRAKASVVSISLNGTEYVPGVPTQVSTNNYEINLSGEIVHIGSATSEFSPVIRFNRFANESFVELNLIGGGSVARFTTSSLVNGVITAENQWFILAYNSVDSFPPYNEMGGVDFKITLKRKPSINTITFTYNHQACDAFVQPPLTQAEIDGGSFRPDYVVNSIAFYHNSKGGMNAEGGTDYKTGKIGHLYRLRVRDSSATPKETWADWGLSANGAQITLTIDQTFLNTATYPVTIAPVGDTFGYTTAGGTWLETSSTGPLKAIYTMGAADGTANEIHCYWYTENGGSNLKSKCALYSGNSVVTNGLTNEVNTTMNSYVWVVYTFATSPSLTASADYGLTTKHEGGDGFGDRTFYDTASYSSSIDTTAYTSAFPDPWSADTTWTDRRYSIHCDYTPAASYDISNNPSSKAFGIVTANTTYYAKGSAPSNPVVDGDCTFTLTNNGASAIDIDVHGHAFTGGVGWTLTSGAPGSNTVRLTVYYSGQNPASGIVITTSDQEFYDGLVASGHIHWDFKLETGTFTDGTAKTGIVTLTAVAED